MPLPPSILNPPTEAEEKAWEELGKYSLEYVYDKVNQKVVPKAGQEHKMSKLVTRKWKPVDIEIDG